MKLLDKIIYNINPKQEEKWTTGAFIDFLGKLMPRINQFEETYTEGIGKFVKSMRKTKE